MNVAELVGKYAWIEFVPNGLVHNTIEYTLYINWLDGSLYAKQIVFTDLANCYPLSKLNILELEVNQIVNDFIKHLEKLQ